MPAPESTLSTAARGLLQSVRDLFGAGNVTVTSTSRTPGYNATIPGASRTSQHIDRGAGADAFDFRVAGMTPTQVQDAIAGAGIGYGQSIAEYGLGMGPRNHLGVGSRQENLIANNGRYSPRQVVADARNDWRGIVNRAARNAFGDATVDGWRDSGESMATDPLGIASLANDYILRAAFGIVAILLIAAAIFTVAKGNLPLPIKAA